MHKYYTVLISLLIIFVIPCSTTSWCAVDGEPIPVYDNLKTFVRLCDSHAASRNSARCEGLCLAFETRTINRIPVWHAIVMFSPTSTGTLDLLDHALISQESKVTMHYFVHPTYQQNVRAYGQIADDFTTGAFPASAGNSSFHIVREDRTYMDSTSGIIIDRYYKNLGHAYLEWEFVPQYTKTLNDLIAAINRFRGPDGRFPKYALASDTNTITRSCCFSCTTFSAALLNRVGVRVDVSDYIKYYTNIANRNSPVATGATVGGLSGALIGALAGTPGGPGGMLVGAFIGLFSGGGVGTASGAVVQGASEYLDPPTRAKILREVFNRDRGHHHVRVVRLHIQSPRGARRQTSIGALPVEGVERPVYLPLAIESGANYTVGSVSALADITYSDYSVPPGYNPR